MANFLYPFVLVCLLLICQIMAFFDKKRYINRSDTHEFKTEMYQVVMIWKPDQVSINNRNLSTSGFCHSIRPLKENKGKCKHEFISWYYLGVEKPLQYERGSGTLGIISNSLVKKLRELEILLIPWIVVFNSTLSAKNIFKSRGQFIQNVQIQIFTMEW